MRAAPDFDVVVVGAGVVGLAIARACALEGASVLVLEREAGIGQGVSSRSSEVIHAGLYYPTGSLRARLCVEGRRRMYEFARTHKVAHAKCGKLVVAVDESEAARLAAIYEQARRNGVEGLLWLTGEETRAVEPAVAAAAALLSPESGVIDSHGLMLALLGDLEAAGGLLARRAPLHRARPLPEGGFLVKVGGAAPAAVACARLVLAAGLGAQAVAAAVEGYPAEHIPSLHLAKGTYFRLTMPAPFQRLIYPVPVPGGLGTHLTRDLAGQGRFGPDIAFVDQPDYGVDPERAHGFARDIRRWWPGLPADALAPDYAAIRPKIHGPGEPQPDFRIDGPDRHGLPGLIALFGIESPGLTASLAIGDHVAARLDGAGVFDGQVSH